MIQELKNVQVLTTDDNYAVVCLFAGRVEEGQVFHKDEDPEVVAACEYYEEQGYVWIDKAEWKEGETV